MAPLRSAYEAPRSSLCNLRTGGAVTFVFSASLARDTHEGELACGQQIIYPKCDLG